MTTEYYALSDERAEAIATLAEISITQVREIALADWSEGNDHQRWLDTAPIEDIATWLLDCVL